jgi:hypothetical protein
VRSGPAGLFLRYLTLLLRASIHLNMMPKRMAKRNATSREPLRFTAPGSRWCDGHQPPHDSPCARPWPGATPIARSCRPDPGSPNPVGAVSSKRWSATP